MYCKLLRSREMYIISQPCNFDISVTLMWSGIFYSFDLLCQVHLALPQVYKRTLMVTPTLPCSESPVCPFSYYHMRSAATAVFVWNPCAKIVSLGVGHIGDSLHNGSEMLSEFNRRLIPWLSSYEKAKLDIVMHILCVKVLLSEPIMAQSVNKS